MMMAKLNPLLTTVESFVNVGAVGAGVDAAADVGFVKTMRMTMVALLHFDFVANCYCCCCSH